jgi:hypothetical protein
MMRVRRRHYRSISEAGAPSWGVAPRPATWYTSNRRTRGTAMARRKPDRSTERGERRAETNAVAAYLTALRAPKVPARNRAKLVERACPDRAVAERRRPVPIEELRLVQRRLDIDADLAGSTKPTDSPSSRKRSSRPARVLAKAGLLET